MSFCDMGDLRLETFVGGGKGLRGPWILRVGFQCSLGNAGKKKARSIGIWILHVGFEKFLKDEGQQNCNCEAKASTWPSKRLAAEKWKISSALWAQAKDEHVK